MSTSIVPPWLPFKGDTDVPEPAFIYNGGSIGSARAIPNCAVWFRLSWLDGTLDTGQPNNLVVGRQSMNFVGNF